MCVQVCTYGVRLHVDLTLLSMEMTLGGKFGLILTFERPMSEISGTDSWSSKCSSSHHAADVCMNFMYLGNIIFCYFTSRQINHGSPVNIRPDICDTIARIRKNEKCEAVFHFFCKKKHLPRPSRASSGYSTGCLSKRCSEIPMRQASRAHRWLERARFLKNPAPPETSC